MVLGAAEHRTVGKTEFKQLLSSFQIGDVRLDRTVQRHDPWTGVGLAQTLNGGRLSRDWVQHSGISGNA